MPRIVAIAVLAILIAACGRESAERLAARQSAHRDWCIAEELAVQSNAQISKLDTIGGDSASPVNAVIYPFARAYFDFAKARERQMALLDSALSAGSAQDSARFAQRSAEAGPRTPSNPVEANAAHDYERHFAAAMGNPAHPCNVEPDRGR